MRGLVVALLLAAPAAAHAAGWALAEQSTVAGGTAGAGTARPDDAGAAWYNPAALADGGGLRLGLGLLFAFPALSAEAVDGSWAEDSETAMATPPHLYASHASGNLAYGIALGVPFGAGVAWPESWAGRHEIVSTRLEVFRAAPFVAYRMGRARLSVGLHVDRARLRIQRALDFIDVEGNVALDLTGTGLGMDAALFYEATDALDVGLTYKSRTRVKLDGGADFDAPEAFGVKTTDQEARAKIRLPDRVAAGVRWSRGPLAIVADLELTLWQVNDRLVVDFARDETPDAIQENRWRRTVGLRGGVEHGFRKVWTARGGLFLDPSPAQSETLAPSSPDSTRAGATVGLSRAFGATSVDAFYEYMHLLGRETENMESIGARYGGRAQMLGVGLRYQR